MRRSAWIGLAVVVLVWCGATRVVAQEPPLILSLSLPLTGTSAAFGEVERRSYELALEEINAAGGVRGRALALKFEDSRGEAAQAAALAKSFAAAGQPLLFGEYSSGCTKAVAQVAQTAGVPYLAVTGAADEITRPGHALVFRLCPANAYYAAGLMSFLFEVAKPRSVAIVYESSEFGVSGAVEMAKAAEAAGIKVLAQERYEKGAGEFRPLLAGLKALAPDLVYMVSYVEDAAALMLQAREMRLPARMFAGGAAGFAIPEFVALAKEASEFVFSASLWSPTLPFPGAARFAEVYAARHGQVPSYHGAEAYAALFVVRDALTRAAALTPAEVARALKATDLMTAFGPVRFVDRDGYMNQNFLDTSMLQVIGGKHQTVWPRKVKSAEYVYPVPGWRDRR